MSSDFDIMRVFLLWPAVRPESSLWPSGPKRNRDFAEKPTDGKAQFPEKSPIRRDLSADSPGKCRWKCKFQRKNWGFGVFLTLTRRLRAWGQPLCRAGP